MCSNPDLNPSHDWDSPITAYVLTMAVCQVSLSQPVPLGVLPSLVQKTPVGTSSTGFSWARYAFCHSTSTVKALKKTQSSTPVLCVFFSGLVSSFLCPTPD